MRSTHPSRHCRIPTPPGKLGLRYTLSNVKVMFEVCRFETHEVVTMRLKMLNLIRRRFRKECAHHAYTAEIVADLTA